MLVLCFGYLREGVEIALHENGEREITVKTVVVGKCRTLQIFLKVAGR